MTVTATAQHTVVATVRATATVRVTITATATVTASPAAVQPTPVATKQPQGGVAISRFQNDIGYSAHCAKVLLTIANRSDTPVDTIDVHYSSSDSRSKDIDAGWRHYQIGLQSFAEKTYAAKVCDDRMATTASGPDGAIPDDITWVWFGHNQ